MSDLELIPDFPVLTGTGKLSGSFKLDTLPGGITYSDITIRAYYIDPLGGRFNGIQAAQVNCQSTGQWLIAGISDLHRYNVVISIPGYNDIIYSNKATSDQVPPIDPEFPVVENLVFEVTSEGGGENSTSFTVWPTAGGAGGFINTSDGGSYELQDFGKIDHVFDSAGTYQITISGDLDGVLFDIPEPTKILSWGKEIKGVQEDEMSFELLPRKVNFISVPDHLPPWITSLDYFFKDSPDFNQDISSWNTKNVKSMNMMFLEAESFNQDLSGWCVPHIPYGPYGFGLYVHGWTLPKPVWGTCPNGEDLVEPEEPKDPVVGNEYLTIKFHNAGDVLSYRKMTALGLNDLPLETVEEPVMEGINSYMLTVGVDDIVKFKFDPITGLPPGMEEMLSQLNVVSHGGLDITVMELPNTQDAPSLAYANNVIVEAALPSVMTNLRGMFSGTVGTISGISNWDVSKVTDMSDMFYDCTAFNSDLSTWVVSKVTDMSNMFYACNTFNSDISQWDVSNVTNMFSMFSSAYAFNGDMPTWDVSNVTTMTHMFSYANAFNGDISQWDTSSVTDMANMFTGTISFNGDLSNWNVSNVTDMSSMFQKASAFNGDISQWNVSNVTTMTRMFQDAIAFNGDLSQWDVSKVTSMTQMFEDANSFNQDLSNWDVSSVTSMINMFYGATSFNSDLSGWCVPKITREPYGFDDSAEAWTLPRPVWGTCPSS